MFSNDRSGSSEVNDRFDGTGPVSVDGFGTRSFACAVRGSATGPTMHCGSDGAKHTWEPERSVVTGARGTGACGAFEATRSL